MSRDLGSVLGDDPILVVLDDIDGLVEDHARVG